MRDGRWDGRGIGLGTGMGEWYGEGNGNMKLEGERLGAFFEFKG